MRTDPDQWRLRAAEMRAIADEMKCIDTRVIMMRLADDYDNRADKWERKNAGSTDPGRGRQSPL